MQTQYLEQRLAVRLVVDIDKRHMCVELVCEHLVCETYERHPVEGNPLLCLFHRSIVARLLSCRQHLRRRLADGLVLSPVRLLALRAAVVNKFAARTDLADKGRLLISEGDA